MPSVTTIDQERMDTSTEDQNYFSNESLEDRNSTTSSTESSNISVERRKDHEFIPTRMKTINASKPAANPAQFTKVPSNPLLISAQKQMLQVEEIKKAKELAHQAKGGGAKGDETPEWQSNLSSWKSRRRKQSEETLLRVAEIKVLSEGDSDGQSRKVSLSKKLSGLLHTDEDDWSDLGLAKPSAGDSYSHDKRRSFSKSPVSPVPESDEDHPHNSDYEREDGDDEEEDEDGEPQSLERWKSSTSLSGSQKPREPARKKSSELSETMRSKLEAFERAQKEEAEQKRQIEEKRKLELENEHVGHFREKLKNFQKISSQSELKNKDGFKSGEKKQPPPPLSYSKLIEPQHYASSSSMKLEQDPNDDDTEDFDFNKDLDDALEESYKSVLGDTKPTPTRKTTLERDAAEAKLIFKDNDFLPSEVTPPSEKPPPPPPVMPQAPSGALGNENKLTSKENEDLEEEQDKMEREIIASLQKEENEHKRYMQSVQSMKSMSVSQTMSTTRTTGTSRFHEQHESQQKQVVVTPVVPMPGGSGSSTSSSLTIPVKAKSNSSSNININNAAPLEQRPSSVKQQHPGFAPQQNQPMKTVSAGNLPALPKKKEIPLSPSGQTRTYNQHWLVQEAEQRRIAESRQNHSPASAPRQPISSVTPSPPNSSLSGHSPPVYENTAYNQKSVPHPQQQQQFQTQTQDLPQNQRHSQQEQHSHHQQQQQQPIYNNVDNSWKGQTIAPNTKKPGLISNTSNYNESLYANLGHNGPAPAMHSTHYPQREIARIPGPQVPPRNSEPQNSLLSVSGKKKCSHCKEELGRGAAMIIESLRLFYHLRCFQCCVCQVQLGNGTAGTDVRVRNNKLHCQNCYSNDEGLKFSKV